MLLKNINKLKNDTIARGVIHCEDFANGFVQHILKTKDINLYCRAVESHESVTSYLFKSFDTIKEYEYCRAVDNCESLTSYPFNRSDTIDENELVNFLFLNLNKISDSPAIKRIIFESSVFCNLLGKEILKNDKLFDKLDALSIKHMLSQLEDNIKKKVFTMILGKITMYPNKVITASLEEGCKMQDEEQYSVKVAKKVCEDKNYELLKKLDGYHFHFLMDDPFIWFKFVLENIEKLQKDNGNKELMDHMVCFGNFCYSLIDKMKKEDSMLVDMNCEFLERLYLNVNLLYKHTLHDIYFEGRSNLHNIDIHAILRSWNINFVKKLLNELIEDGRTDFLTKDDLKYLEYRDVAVAKEIMELLKVNKEPSFPG